MSEANRENGICQVDFKPCTVNIASPKLIVKEKGRHANR